MMKNKVLSIEPLGFPWKTFDPYLFCAHHRDEYPAGNDKMGVNFEQLNGRNVGQDFILKDGWRMYHGSNVPGFPYHPHRGFETITINKEGFVDHTDSLGAAGRFGAGDVQWMTAGRGLQHSEMFPLINSDKGNPLEIFQIWLNLPKKNKMVEPHFKMLWDEQIPKIKQSDDLGNIDIDLIAGELWGNNSLEPTPHSWAADSQNGVCVATIKMDPHTTLELPSRNLDLHRTLYFYRGSLLTIEGETVSHYSLVRLDPTQKVSIRNGETAGYILLLEGRPIDEPVAQHGPFVMNTPEEIQEAFAEFRRTEFGGWPWPEREQVHHRSKGRFALYADGLEEIKA